MLFLLLFILLLYNTELVSLSITESLLLFITKVFPSLFLYLFIIDLFICSKSFLRFGKIFHPLGKALFKSPSYICTSIIFSSLFLGSPTNIKLIYDLYKNKSITFKNANLLMMFCNFTSLSFIITMSNNLNNQLYIIIALILGNIFLGFFVGLFFEKEKPIKFNKKYNFSSTLEKNMILLFKIMTIIIIINCFISLITTNNQINKKTLGFLEISTGLNSLNINDGALFVLFSAFSGLSIHLQVFSIIKKDLSYSLFLIGRILSSLLALSFYFILILIF